MTAYTNRKTLTPAEVADQTERDARSKSLAKTRVTFGRCRKVENESRVEVRLDGSEYAGYLYSRSRLWFANDRLENRLGRPFAGLTLAEIKAAVRQVADA